MCTLAREREVREKPTMTREEEATPVIERVRVWGLEYFRRKSVRDMERRQWGKNRLTGRRKVKLAIKYFLIPSVPHFIAHLSLFITVTNQLQT